MRGISRLALLGFVLAIAVAGLLVPASVNVVRNLMEQEDGIAHGYRTLREFDDLRVNRAEAEAFYVAFLYSGETKFIGGFDRAGVRIVENWQKNRPQLRQANADIADALGTALLADMTAMRKAMELRQSAGARTARRLIEQEQRADELDVRIAGMMTALRAEQNARIEALRRNRDAGIGMAWKSAALLLAALVGGLGWLYWLIVRSQRRGEVAIGSLRDSEARFRSLIELSADWYWEQDEQQRFTFLSAEADAKSNLNMSTLGLTRREVPGIDLASADWDAHEKTCSARQPFRDFTYRRFTPDGAVHWIRTSGEPWFDSCGVFKGYRGVGSDITQQRRAEQEIVRLKDMYAALSQTNRAIVRIHEPEMLFDEVCRVAVEYGHFCLAWIGLVEEATGWIHPIAIRGPVSEVYKRMRVSVNPDIPEGRGFAGSAVRDNRHYIVNDFLAEPRVAPWAEQARAAGVRSLATFPLRRAGHCVGVLNLHGDEIGFFTDELVALLTEMAANISFALTNMQFEAEREAAKRALYASEQKFRHLAANVPEVFWTADPDPQNFTYVSPAYEKIFGRRCDALLQNASEWMDAIHPSDRPRIEASRPLAINGNLDQEFRIVRPDGDVRWLHNRSFPVLDESGQVTMITGIAEDVTSRKLDEEKLQFLAHYDNLTELPNRSLFFDRLQQTILHARREGRAVAVVFVDVDHFKRVNDTLGHAAGDRLLQQVARRLESAVRAGDTVGRLGGDEFALILSNLANASDAGLVAQKLMDVLHKSFDVEGRELFVTASAGVTLFPDDSEDPDTLIKNADIAMYRAKELGRNAYQFFKSEMNARALERMSMENHLRRALERNEFQLYYQPKVNIASGEITGLEALLRWQHPELGMVSPVRFIPILEDNGLIIPVGEWVLGEVCRQIGRWMGDRALSVVPVAVNLSGHQLQQKDIGESLMRIITGFDVNPRLIELEITESVLMRNAEQTGSMLRGLQQFGVRLSMDDFGTGYSSLGYLKSFPLDALKIDRSFVRDIVTDPDDAMITRAIISMAHSLRLKVVAEGVENAAQLALLARAGCDEIQGFHFSKPLPAEECMALVRARRRLLRAQQGGEGEPTLLVVDDDPAMLMLFEKLLRHEGFRILTAADADRALELLATNEVSVVMADQRMPGMPGVELLRRIKSLYPETVRIVMSGEVDVHTATQAINQGAVYRVLNKSLSDEQLRASLKEAFVHKALQDENLRLANRLRALEAVSKEADKRAS
ncbi:MAG: EAL domain-containing protein [Betaproteobacteria bacterium]|nr:EAL domain-containing protein [Betaproteobacteria bacterium]